MLTIHLVDASPYIFRAFFALPETLTDIHDCPVNAVYGFADFLLRLIHEEEVTHLGVAFDRSLTTSFRNDFFPGYKASRPLPPPELEAQLEACEELAGAFGAQTFADERYEADDLIATLCAPLETAGYDIVVVSNDKDLMQLVSGRTELLDFAKGRRYGPAEVEDRFDVRPDQITDLLGLVGDPTDDIPGVKGIGPKTATALLAVFDHIEDIYARLDEVADLPIRGAKSVQKKLAAGRADAELSKRLATVARDAPAQLDLGALRYDGADRKRVDALFERLDFQGIRDRIRVWKD